VLKLQIRFGTVKENQFSPSEKAKLRKAWPEVEL
jgi:hypothetical protein